MKKYDGVSLIELLVAVAVIAVVLTVSVSLLDVVVRNTLATQANDLLASLQRARSEAYMRMQPIALCASSDGASCVANNRDRIWETGWIACVDANNNGLCDNGETLLLGNGALKSDYILRSNANIGGSMRYLSNGRSRNGAGLFVLCKGVNNPDLTKSKAIFVTNSGRIYLGQDSNNNGIPEDEFGTDIRTCKP